MQRLTPAAVAAMDLIKPTLWVANQRGVSASAVRALVQHYASGTVAAAFACLRRLDVINPGTGRRPYNLSERFVRSQQASGLQNMCRRIREHLHAFTATGLSRAAA